MRAIMRSRDSGYYAVAYVVSRMVANSELKLWTMTPYGYIRYASKVAYQYYLFDGNSRGLSRNV